MTRARADVASSSDPAGASVGATAAMRQTFERCARRALRRPDPTERSLLMRRLFRILVPKGMRPQAKRVLLTIFRAGDR